jgi:hypothetical protein
VDAGSFADLFEGVEGPSVLRESVHANWLLSDNIEKEELQPKARAGPAPEPVGLVMRGQKAGVHRKRSIDRLPYGTLVV